MYSSFKDNIWGAHLADMQLISKFNKGFRILLCDVIDIYSKHAWVVSLKDKEGITLLTNAFKEILDESWRKPNKISLEMDNDIEMYSTLNEEKSVITKRFIIYKYVISVSKNVYTDKLDKIVNKYNTYHSTIKMKPVDGKSRTYIDYGTENNDKDHVKMRKYENIFTKSYIPNWSEEVFVIKKVKNTVPWTIFISDLNGEEIVRTFYEK